MPSVREPSTWAWFVGGRHGRYDDPRARFTLTGVDEDGKERELFPYEREEVQRMRAPEVDRYERSTPD